MSEKPRLDPWTPDRLDDAAKKLYKAVLDSPRGAGGAQRILLRDDGSLTGPFDAWLHSPELGLHLERVGMAFRTDTALPHAAREVAVLVVAKAWNAAFEWWVHGLVGFHQLVSGVLETFHPPPPSGDLPVVGPPQSTEPA